MKVEFGTGPVCPYCNGVNVKRQTTDPTGFNCNNCVDAFDWHPDGIVKDKCPICESKDVRIEQNGTGEYSGPRDKSSRCRKCSYYWYWR